MTIETAIEKACDSFGQWMATLQAWENAPWRGNNRGYRGPTLLGEADCRMHLSRFLTDFVPPEWLHLEVPASEYLFPTATVRRQLRLDIGIVDPQRLHYQITYDQMKLLKWNAFIEVKFRGQVPGWEFAVASEKEIQRDALELVGFLPYCDRAYLVVIEETDHLDEAIVRQLEAEHRDIRLIFVPSRG
jgi:hypothetical protein